MKSVFGRLGSRSDDTHIIDMPSARISGIIIVAEEQKLQHNRLSKRSGGQLRREFLPRGAKSRNPWRDHSEVGKITRIKHPNGALIADVSGQEVIDVQPLLKLERRSPSSGEIELLGQSLSRLDDEARAALRSDAIGFVFQSFLLIPSLSALENVMLPSIIKDEEGDELRAAELLHQVGLAGRERRFEFFPPGVPRAQQLRKGSLGLNTVRVGSCCIGSMNVQDVTKRIFKLRYQQ